MKNSTKSVLAVSAVALFIGLKITIAVVRWNESDDSFDPENIDIRPALEATLAEMQRKETEELMAGINRQFQTAENQGRELRMRWVEAQKAGLVGDTGVLYVPSENQLAYDGTPNEFRKAQTTPPKTGWYVIFKKEKSASGQIKAGITAGGTAEDYPVLGKEH